MLDYTSLKRRLLASAVLVPAAMGALAVLVYLNAMWNGFAPDDVVVLQHNPVMQRLSWDLLTAPYWPGSRELYRPTTVVSLALDWTLSGGATGWLHGVNVALHGVVTVLVWGLLRGLGASTRVAIVGAALFAVHPVHVEAVVPMVGRSE